MAYVLFGHSISADKVFSVAQYFHTLQFTMAILYPLAVAAVAETAVSMERIEVRNLSDCDKTIIYQIRHIA